MYQPLVVYSVSGGYRPSQSYGGPDAAPNVLFRGLNYWLRPYGRLVPVRGVSLRQTGLNTTGSRIFPLNTNRGVIGGTVVNAKSSLVRYNQALFYLSQETGQQVYINESTTTPFTLTGVTTSATAGRLRVALLSGTTYAAHDAGLPTPASIGTVSIEPGGTKGMDGIVSLIASAKRIATETISNPSTVAANGGGQTQTLSSSGNNRIRVVLPAAISGQDAWMYGGTYWGQGNFGPWRLIREVRVTIEGTIGIATQVLTGTGTRFTRDLHVGDVITVNGADYTIATITSDTSATVVSGADQAAPKTATVKEIVLEWRNGELTDLFEFDNDEPPILDGLMLFNNVPFGWRDNVLYPSKIGNPESFPRILARSTQSGANIVHALAGDARIFLLTTNGLEVVTFTQNPADPFLIRQAWSFGFSGPAQAVVAEGTLFAAVGTSTGVKIVRTRVDDSPDLEFAAPVESDMATWDVSRVVMGLDPSNGAVLAMHYDGSTYTTIIPYMLQQGVWGLPIQVTGQVVSAATVNNTCELIIKSGAEFKVYQWEGGTGAGTVSFVAFPFLDKDGPRQTIKAIKFTGAADNLYIFKGEPGLAIPDVTDISKAVVSLPLAGCDVQHQNVVFTNIPNAQSFSVRVDSAGNSAVVTEVVVNGIVNGIQR